MRQVSQEAISQFGNVVWHCVSCGLTDTPLGRSLDITKLARRGVEERECGRAMLSANQ